MDSTKRTVKGDRLAHEVIWVAPTGGSEGPSSTIGAAIGLAALAGSASNTFRLVVWLTSAEAAPKMARVAFGRERGVRRGQGCAPAAASQKDIGSIREETQHKFLSALHHTASTKAIDTSGRVWRREPPSRSCVGRANDVSTNASVLFIGGTASSSCCICAKLDAKTLVSYSLGSNISGRRLARIGRLCSGVFVAEASRDSRDSHSSADKRC